MANFSQTNVVSLIVATHTTGNNQTLNSCPDSLVPVSYSLNPKYSPFVLHPGKRISLYIGSNTRDQTNTHSYTPERPRIKVFILFYSLLNSD